MTDNSRRGFIGKLLAGAATTAGAVVTKKAEAIDGHFVPKEEEKDEFQRLFGDDGGREVCDLEKNVRLYRYHKIIKQDEEKALEFYKAVFSDEDVESAYNKEEEENRHHFWNGVDIYEIRRIVYSDLILNFKTCCDGEEYKEKFIAQFVKDINNKVWEMKQSKIYAPGFCWGYGLPNVYHNQDVNYFSVYDLSSSKDYTFVSTWDSVSSSDAPPPGYNKYPKDYTTSVWADSYESLSGLYPHRINIL